MTWLIRERLITLFCSRFFLLLDTLLLAYRHDAEVRNDRPLHPSVVQSHRLICVQVSLDQIADSSLWLRWYGRIRASTDIEVEDVAIRRTVAVTVGTLWGWVVTQYVFPFEARKEMRKGLTEYVKLGTSQLCQFS